MLALITIAVVAATMLGGLFALRFHDKFHLILGFSAGAVIGISFFDLLPESIELAQGVYEISLITSIMAVGFLIYMVLNQHFSLHAHADEDDETCGNPHHHGSSLGAGSLSLHSLLDGIAIGLAFQASTEVGLVVAAAVLAHDFSDGINTVSLVLKNGGSKTQAFKWLLADAAAPAIGIFSTLFFTLPEAELGLLLALFTGFFFYIGASDLLPEIHHKHATWSTSLATILGVTTIYAAITLAGV